MAIDKNFFALLENHVIKTQTVEGLIHIVEYMSSLLNANKEVKINEFLLAATLIRFHKENPIRFLHLQQINKLLFRLLEKKQLLALYALILNIFLRRSLHLLWD